MRPIRMTFLALAVTLMFSVVANDAAAQDFEHLSAAIDSTNEHVTALQGNADLTAENVQVVRTSELLLDEEQSTALNNSLEMNNTAITDLRTTLSTNEPVATALGASQAGVDEVVGLHVANDGRTTVYVQDE